MVTGARSISEAIRGAIRNEFAGWPAMPERGACQSYERPFGRVGGNDPVSEPSPGWSVEVHQGLLFTSHEPLDGQKYTVNGPDGATCEQAFALLQDWRRGKEGRSAERGARALGKLPATRVCWRFAVLGRSRRRLERL